MSIDLLIEKIKMTKNPSVMGLDPNVTLIPEFIKKQEIAKYGNNLKALATSAYQFNKGLMDAVCGLIPAVKPQSAYYEMYGYEGVRILYKTIQYAKKKGFYVITDVKRNDIGSTAQAYAQAYLGDAMDTESQKPPFGSDSLTVNPYLGTDGVAPFAEFCKTDKSMFVLVKTSNPSSGELQDLELKDGEKLYEKVARLVDSWGKESVGKCGYSNIGAVVGATYPQIAKDLREIMPNTYFLVPGYGAQGAGAKDIAVSFKNGLGAIVNSSRGIMNAYKKFQSPEEDFMECARREVIRMRDEIALAID